MPFDVLRNSQLRNIVDTDTGEILEKQIVMDLDEYQQNMEMQRQEQQDRKKKRNSKNDCGFNRKTCKILTEEKLWQLKTHIFSTF